MTSLQQGYMVRNYMVDNYMVGAGTEITGMQALIVRDKLQSVSVQARVDIINTKAYAAQAQLLITKTTLSAFQGNLTLTQKSYSAFQTTVQAVRQTHSGFQSALTIQKKSFTPFQANLTRGITTFAAFQSLVQVSKENARVGTQAALTIDTQKRGSFQALHTPVRLNAYGFQAFASVTRTAQFTACTAGITQIMHYNLSFMSGNYLTGAYHIPRVNAFVPMQANINQSQKTPTAVQALITPVQRKNSAVQTLVTISKTNRFPFQARVLQIRRTLTPVQALVIQERTNKSAVQALITIAKRTRVAFQASVFSGISVAFQGRVVIYNTTKLRILTDFPSRGLNGVNWTCNSVATGDFSPNNLNTDLVEQVFRTAPGGVTNIELVCDTQLAQGVFVDTLALLNHNLSGSATVSFDGSNFADFAFVETVPLILDRTRNAYYVAPTMPLVSYRYWRFRINDVANPDGFIEIGTIVFGSSVIFAGDNFVDQVRFGRRQFADSVFTEGFTNVKNDRGLKKNLNLEFKNLEFSRSDYKNLRTIIETQSTLFKCLWIPTPDSPSRFALFGKLTELPQETSNYKGKDADFIDVSLNVDEAE